MAEQCEEPAYTSILKDLAAAVKRSPPKEDGLTKWTEVLATNLRDLPVDYQHEARHSIDSYVIGLRRMLRQQERQEEMLTPRKGMKGTKGKGKSSTVTTESSASASCGPDGTPQQSRQPSPQMPSPQLTPSRSHTLQPLQNVFPPGLSPYTTARQLFGPQNDANEIINQLMMGAPQLPSFQGNM